MRPAEPAARFAGTWGAVKLLLASDLLRPWNWQDLRSIEPCYGIVQDQRSHNNDKSVVGVRDANVSRQLSGACGLAYACGAVPQLSIRQVRHTAWQA